jgi:hypothetical protein
MGQLILPEKSVLLPIRLRTLDIGMANNQTAAKARTF